MGKSNDAGQLDAIYCKNGTITNFRTEEGYFDRLPETTTPTPPIHGVPRVINSLIKAAMVLSTIVAIGMLI